jgi:hypothetical protein
MKIRKKENRSFNLHKTRWKDTPLLVCFWIKKRYQSTEEKKKEEMEEWYNPKIKFWVFSNHFGEDLQDTFIIYKSSNTGEKYLIRRTGL